MTSVTVNGIRRYVTLRTVFVVIALINFHASAIWWLVYALIAYVSRSHRLTLNVDRPVHFSYYEE